MIVSILQVMESRSSELKSRKILDKKLTRILKKRPLDYLSPLIFWWKVLQICMQVILSNAINFSFLCYLQLKNFPKILWFLQLWRTTNRKIWDWKFYSDIFLCLLELVWCNFSLKLCKEWRISIETAFFRFKKVLLKSNIVHIFRPW